MARRSRSSRCPTAQPLFHKVGQLDEIDVAAAHGVSDTKLVAAIKPLLPASAQVRTGQGQAQQATKDTAGFLNIFQDFLLAFGGIALFVGSFVIANTLSITVAQRTRELATLRTLGATRRQVRASVMLEALVIGVLASIVGLFLGLALAKGLNALFVSFGIDLPQTSTVFKTRTIIVSLVVGILITLLAALRPAIRSTRVPPIAAVREGSVLPPGRFARFGAYPAIGTISRRGRPDADRPARRARCRPGCGCCRSGSGQSACSSASRCWPRGSCRRWCACWAGRPPRSAAARANSRGATRCAIRRGPRQPHRR